MRREQRLRSSADFERVRREGRAWRHTLVVLFTAPGGSERGETRVGVTTGRRIGGAVVRNRMRRRIRECLRQLYGSLAPGWDLVVVGRAASTEASHREMCDAVVGMLRRAGLLVGEG